MRKMQTIFQSRVALNTAIIIFLIFSFLKVSVAQTGTKITQTTLVETKINSVKHILCNGDKKGAINIMVSGGVPPYSYEWSNGATTQDIAGLEAGIYTVVVVDTYGCPDTLIVEVKQPPKLEVAIDSVRDVLCYSFDNGRIDVSVKGGVAPYVYSWSNETSSQDLVNASAGEYALLVTDANHCQEIASAYIKQNPLIVRSNEKVQNVSCAGDSTGLIDINVNGGVPPYSFKWTSGETTEDLDNLVAGTYTVMVNDSRGCTEAYSTKVFEPDGIEVKIEEVRHINCAGDNSGAISIKVKGGVSPYKYQWNDSMATTEDLAGLVAGDYKLVITDKNSCKEYINQEINEPEKLIVDIKSVKNVSNYGGNDGAIYIDVNGGVKPYKYSWSNGPKTQNVANIPANNYTCRIVDKNKCVNTISVNIDQPSLLKLETEHVEHIKCFGEKNGYINVKVSGGVPPYKYVWNTGAETKDIKDLVAGTYNLKVTDANGNIETLKETIKQPEKLTSSIQSTANIDCYDNKDGIVDINVSGGTTPYKYNWNNGAKTQDISKVPAGEYSVQITDNNLCVDTISATITQSPQLVVSVKEIVNIKCFGKAEGAISVDVKGGVEPYVYNWNNGAVSRNLSALKVGNYNLKVTDAKGCYQFLDAVVSEPELLTSKIEKITDVKCKGDSTGEISIDINGGTTPYSYKWSNGVSVQNNSNITAGSYSVKIIDAKGCSNDLSATVVEPSKLIASLDKITNIDCYDETTGAIDVSVVGGVSPYSYAWSNNATTQNIVNIKAGDYSLKVQDQNGCISSIEANVKQNSILKSTVDNIVHVKCNGDLTGEAKISIEGGIEPYSYKWSNGANTKDLLKVKANSYTLEIVDAKGCVLSQDVKISEPPVFEGEITSLKQIGCHGDSNGEIITAFKGGVQPYKYLWNTKQATKDIKNLPAGGYEIVATDNNGCIKKLDAVINQPSKLELSLVSSTNNLCFGERKGAIDIAVKGGVTPYSYKWSNSATTQDLDVLEAGTYKVYVTGATGCEKSIEATIEQPQALGLTVVKSKDVKCFGESNGAIDIAVRGGVEPYVYSWSNGATTQDISAIVAGSYTVNVEDRNGCVNKTSVIIKQQEVLEAKIADVKNIDCFGESTGAISIDVVGGVKPYKYLWSNGATAEDIDNLKVGKYSVAITDSNGCKQTLEAKITQPTNLKAEIISTQNVNCNGVKEGSIDISVIGGVTPYVYTWSNGSKEQDVTNIGAGEYNVKIEDKNGCIRTLKTEITEPSMLVVSIDDINNITEYGNKNASISIAVGGGVAPYKYSWSNGASTQNIKNLIAGNYSVIVTDSKECRHDLNATITQPEEITVSIDSIKHIKCFGETTGYALISAKGGVAPYTFEWSNGVSKSELKDIPAGTYDLIITDANGASKTEKVVINQPEAFKLSIDNATNPTCYELNNGSIKAKVVGGTTPYKFAWSNGATTQNLKGLTSGKFAITVTDAMGCELSDSTELTKPDPLEVVLVSTTDILCNGEHKGAVDIDVKGGVAPYKFNWNHGSKEEDLSGVIAGNYSVKVTDANQCLKTVNTTIKEPSLLVSKLATVKDVPCFGENKGAISTSVTGGFVPYTYSWNTGDTASAISGLVVGNYDVRITDKNGCVNALSTKITEPTKLTGFVKNVNHISCNADNEGAINIVVDGGSPPYKFGWNNGAVTQNLSGIAAGDYSVKVIDEHGCEIELETKVEEPQKLVANVENIENIKCFGDKIGSINVAVSGGVESYKYSWSNGATTQDLSNIIAGNYSLKVTDKEGCFTTAEATVVEPQLLVVENTSINNNKCNGDSNGAITVSVTGGQAPYVYKWSNGAATRDIQDVKADEYKLLVTDANGCTEVSVATITEPPLLNKSIDAIKHISCNGESNGTVSISVSGGTVPYTYQWSNGNTTQDLIDVPAGDYSVIIREGNNCESTLDVTINEPTPFISDLLDTKHNLCYGEKNGSVTISAEGGTPPYSFDWNNGASTQNLKNIVSGDYSVLVSDANGCTKTLKTQVAEPDRLVLTIDSARNVKCCGDTSGAIFITVKGGVEPYDYLWSHGAKTQDITGLVEGQYTVVVTDANGCVVETPEEGATIYEKIIAQGKFISRDILFDIGKATIKEKSFIEINRIASFMKEHPQLRFSIEGHTDSQGDAKANQKLSERRAKAIKSSLIKFGIAANRLETAGKGETEPIDSNATKKGRAKNRRVEFIPM